MKNVLSIIALFSACLCFSCSQQNEEDTPDVPQPQPTAKIPINLSVGITTRATDASFETGDRVGIYVVNYENGQPGVLKNQGNHVDNMLFTFNGRWVSQTEIYWKDQTTHADFYAYYPYQAGISNVSALPFSIKADQSTKANYTASDFLWGKKSDQTPTSDPVNIQTRHLMSSAVVKLAPGDGFTAESLIQANPVVTINGVKPDASINLTNGTVTVSGQPIAITPLKQDDEYRALIVPQTVEATNFVNVNIDGRDYQLNKSFTFEGGKRHTFTVTVTKTAGGINVGITQWETDDTDNGGIAE